MHISRLQENIDCILIKQANIKKTRSTCHGQPQAACTIARLDCGTKHPSTQQLLKEPYKADAEPKQKRD